MSKNISTSTKTSRVSTPRTRSLTENDQTEEILRLKTEIKKQPKKLKDMSVASKSVSTRNQQNFNSTLSQGRKPISSRNGLHPLPKKNKVNTTGITVSKKKLGLSPVTNRSTASISRSNPNVRSTIQARIKKKSPWMDSIECPTTGGGVKIPDPVGTDTGTFQHIENIAVTVNSNGIAGLRVISPWINEYQGDGSVIDGLNYQTTNPTSTSLNMGWGNQVGASHTGFSFGKRVPELIKANALSHRVVSAMVLAQSEVSTLSDAGEFCSFVTPYNCHDRNVGYSTYQNSWDSCILPVNTHKPVVARWYPIESEAALYDGDVSIDHTDNFSYRDFLNPNSDENSPIGVVPWEFGICVSGCTPSVGVVRFQIVVNYEFVPNSSSAMVALSPSPIDPVEEQLVCSWVSESPMTEVVSQKFASKAQSTSTVADEHEPSGFGMIYNVFEAVAPLILEQIPKLAALL